MAAKQSQTGTTVTTTTNTDRETWFFSEWGISVQAKDYTEALAKAKKKLKETK